MSHRARIIVLVALALSVGSASLAFVHRERISFVGKCRVNSNGLSECACTFDALKELPENYRLLAISWAHDTRTEYTISVMRLIVAEAIRAGANRIKDIWDAPDREKQAKAWIVAVMKIKSWTSTGVDPASVAVKVAATEGLPIVYDVGTEFVKTRAILHRRCGRSVALIVQIDDARREGEKIAGQITAGTTEIVTEAASTTVRASGDAALRLWNWLKASIWK